MTDQLINRAQEVLSKNWKNGFTIPTSNLYPFQWNWDSGFVSLGLSHYNLDHALQELRSLFSGQWGNGLLPHIIFHSETEKTYFPNFDFWNSNINPTAPLSPKSSGITQPAVHGFVVEHLIKRFPHNEKVISFAKELFPKIVNYHRFLYTYRDPHKEGLMFIFHPWESGRDNSPLWDESMNRIEIDHATLPEYTRRDTSIADASERPTSDQYDRYVYLLQLGKTNQYDGRAIAEESPFLIQDSMMNAILIKSNAALIKIGKRFGFDIGEIEEWQQQSLASFKKKMWNESLGFFTCYDLRAEKQIELKEIGGLSPIYAGIPTTTQATRLNEYLQSLHKRGYYLCPSFDVDHPLFDSKRYWRGPVWPQMNWMLYHGFNEYGFRETAEIIKADLFTLVSKLGFHEYFESQKDMVPHLERGYGGDNFSWTASTIIDLSK
jgi:hypothetical protein